LTVRCNRRCRTERLSNGHGAAAEFVRLADFYHNDSLNAYPGWRQRASADRAAVVASDRRDQEAAAAEIG
jgi:hypothetical protein